MLQEFLLGEMPLERFISEYLDQKPLIIKGASTLPKHIGVGTVDEYLAAGEGSLHMLTRVLINGEDAIIQPNPGFSTETQKAFIDRQFQQGATIKAEKFETRHPLMAALCREIEHVFGGEAYAMTFLTPAQHQGFTIHFDPVSSFIVQLSGKKHWKVYPEYIKSPTKAMNRPMAGVELPPPLFEATLEPGDLLYMPGGFPHTAECSNAHSLHMTFGITPHRPLDIFTFAMQLASERYVELRCPVRLDNKGLAEQLKAAMNIASNALKEINLENLLRAYENSYNASRYDAFKYGLRNFARSSNATVEMPVRGVKDKPYFISVSDSVLVISPSSTLRPGMPMFADPPRIELPAIANQEVTTMLGASNPVRVKDIPGPLDVESKLNVAVKLASFGLVEFVDDTIAR